REHFPLSRRARERAERRLREEDEHDDRNGAAIPSHFGTDFRPDELGERVAKELAENEGILERERTELLPFVGAGGERLAERVHAEVRREGRQRCVDDESGLRGF